MLALILLSASSVFFWWKWVAAEERADQLAEAFAKHVAEADQRFLAVRDGRSNARSE